MSELDQLDEVEDKDMGDENGECGFEIGWDTFRDDNILNSSFHSLTQYSENIAAMACTDTLRDEVLGTSTQLEKAARERNNLGNRLSGI